VRGVDHDDRAGRLRRRATLDTQVSETTEKKVFLIGGTGRVGASTLRWLIVMGREEKLSIRVVVGGRNKDNFLESMGRLQNCFGLDPGIVEKQVTFERVDYKDATVLEAAIKGCDLVIHTAGPFQQKMDNEVLRASLRQKVAYIDVCDATNLISMAKRELNKEAQDSGVPVIVSTGIWPGVSALMAKRVISSLDGDCSDLEMSFYTAGTGGAGITILSATFLLLAEPSLWIRDGRPEYLAPWTERNRVDFGGDVGERDVFNLDEPEVFMIHDSCGIANVRSSFGTSPDVWNALFGLLRLIPEPILANRELMQLFAAFSLPVVRAVDALVGSTNAMRVDGRNKAGNATACFTCIHPDLESAVGIGAAAFAVEMLLGKVPAGVHFPVELSDETVDAILNRAKVESKVFSLETGSEMNR